MGEKISKRKVKGGFIYKGWDIRPDQFEAIVKLATKLKKSQAYIVGIMIDKMFNLTPPKPEEE